MCLQIIVQLLLVCSSVVSITLAVASSTTTEVFITTANYAPSKKKVQLSNRRAVNTATEAAIAMNSIEFLEQLMALKDTAGMKTYTQPLSSRSSAIAGHTSSQVGIEQTNQSSSYREGFSWNFSRWVFGGESVKSTSSGEEAEEPTSLNESNMGSKHASHETVTEYNAKLWFLPSNKGEMKFRETIRVLSISVDGKSSTVECIAQYYNGSKWVDCSKVICTFSSVPLMSVDNQRHESAKVRMQLDSEILVWLPLPKAASKAVGKKITSVFESAALGFFDELASY